MTNLLLHICCGVCAGGLIEKFRKDGYKITGFFYNPNIHPYKEFLKRLRAVEVLSEAEKLPVFYDRNYGLIEFLHTVIPNMQLVKSPLKRGVGGVLLMDQYTPSAKGGSASGGKSPLNRGDLLTRCARCYEMRLARTADFAKENNFPVFSSTLIISPYQNQSIIRNIGENIAQNKGIVFKYEEVTDLYPQCKEFARKRQLYRQQYCGCIFSEYERFRA